MKQASASLISSDASMARTVLWLASPVLVEQTLLYLVGVSDTLLTGHFLAEEHLAAVTIASYLLWFLGCILTVVSVGASALVARLIGQGDPHLASRICQRAIGLALIIGTVTFLAGWVTAPWIVSVMNVTGSTASLTVQFLRIVLIVTPLLACTTVGNACLRGAGDTRTGMWVMILVNLVNVGLSWALLMGLAPFPRLGFRGIATGTAVGEGVGGLVILCILARGRSGLKLSWQGLIPVGHDVRRILRISLPAAGESLTNLLGQLTFLSLINRLGDTATAAHGVAIRCEAIAFLTITAFSVAASTLTGQFLGARRPDLARSGAMTAWTLGAITLSLMGVLIYLLAGPMFLMFTGGRQPEVVAIGAPVLQVVAFAMPALATINVLNGALRGAGDTRWPWYFALIGYVLVRLPLTYVVTMPGVGEGGLWGLHGAWIAMLLDLYARAILITARFLHGGWKSATV